MLVGRESERSALDALLRERAAERSAALVLRGEPGIGKTACWSTPPTAPAT